MGGWGSGGRNKTHRTVESYGRIDSFELLRQINEAEKPHEIIDPVFYGSTGFRLHWVEGVDGSQSRLYFGCPVCGHRVRYLYDCHGFYVCRHCLGANYESQQVTRGNIEDIRRQMRKIVENQLGYTWWRHDNPNYQINELESIPKPRYMRWAKYNALIMEFRELQDECWRAFIRQYPQALPQGMLEFLSGYL